MSAVATVALVSAVIAELPTVIKTGTQVIALINDAYRQLNEIYGDQEVSKEEITALVRKIVANSAAIQAID